MAHDLPGPRRGEIVEEIVRNAARASAAPSELDVPDDGAQAAVDAATAADAAASVSPGSA
jgi:hypothetical protein